MATASKYPARVVNVENEEDAHPGSIAVAEDALIFSGSSMTLRLTYEEVILDFSGGRNAAVHFQHPDHPQWRVTAYEHRILRERAFKDRANLRQQVVEVRRRQQGVGKVIASIFFVGFVIGQAYVAGYAVENSAPKVVKLLPAARDGEVAQRIRPLVEEAYPSGAYGPLETQLTDVLRHIVPTEERERFQFQAHVVEEKKPIAFSLPGGDVYLSIGILRVAQDAEQIAGLLAHEAAHVIHRHAVKQSVSRKGASMILRGLLGDQEGITRAIGLDARRLVAPDYPNAFEIEADSLAWSMLTKAGINPAGLTTMLTVLVDRNTSTLEEERPLSSLIPVKARWDSFGRLGQAMDKEAKFDPLPPFTIPDPPVAPPSLDL